MRKLTVLAAIVVLSVFIFKMGKFHFSETYLIGRDISLEKFNRVQCHWKISDGIPINGCDVLDETNCFIKNDTLYVYTKPVGCATRLGHRCFTDYELSLESFDGTQKSVYVSK